MPIGNCLPVDAASHRRRLALSSELYKNLRYHITLTHALRLVDNLQVWLFKVKFSFSMWLSKPTGHCRRGVSCWNVACRTRTRLCSPIDSLFVNITQIIFLSFPHRALYFFLFQINAHNMLKYIYLSPITSYIFRRLLHLLQEDHCVTCSKTTCFLQCCYNMYNIPWIFKFTMLLPCLKRCVFRQVLS
jgi:hypothetical protein